MRDARAGEDGYLIAGDGLRALAALAVLAFHAFAGVAVQASSRGQDWGWPGELLVRLNRGLYVFFALSGYLVGGPWVRAWLLGGGFPAPGRYLVRRAGRIVPAFWVVTAAALLWFGTAGAAGRDVLAVFALEQVWVQAPAARVLPQGWTLDVEATFCLALPVLAWGAVRCAVCPPGPRRARGCSPRSCS